MALGARRWRLLFLGYLALGADLVLTLQLPEPFLLWSATTVARQSLVIVPCKLLLPVRQIAYPDT